MPVPFAGAGPEAITLVFQRISRALASATRDPWASIAPQVAARLWRSDTAVYARLARRSLASVSIPRSSSLRGSQP